MAAKDYGAIAAFFIIIVTFSWKMLNWVWLKPRKLEKMLRQQGLKGNTYKFLYGDGKEILKMQNEARKKPMPFTNEIMPRIIPFNLQHREKYGDNSFIWLGPVPLISITEPELIREVYTRIYEFKKPKMNPLFGLLTPGLISYEGEKWAMHRKLINPAFHMEKLKLMLPAMSAAITETINEWEKVISDSSSSSEVNVWPYLTNLSADVISRSAFGSSYEEGRRIFELLKKQTEVTVPLIQSVYIPGWRYVPTKTNRKIKQTNTEICNLLKGIIDKRKKLMENGEAAKNDLLGILMDSNNKETKNLGLNNKQNKLTMSFQDIIDECKLFYFAGQETTSVLLVWTMILLSKYPDWQTRAREEILATFGLNEPDYDGLNRLKTVTNILYEVLRLYPPVISLSRNVFDQDTKLGNFTVPPGAMVWLQLLQVHQDPKIWGEDAKEFKPERFSEGILKATKGNLSFFPFSGGPRICVGQNFALVEAKMALSMILQRFSFELSPSYAHAPAPLTILQPQFGAHLILQRRN